MDVLLVPEATARFADQLVITCTFGFYINLNLEFYYSINKNNSLGQIKLIIWAFLKGADPPSYPPNISVFP